MLVIPGAIPAQGFRFTIMTYNALAQCLVQRKMYPSSGEILKWKVRFRTLQEEITYYDPTILCLQEIDIQNLSLWSTFLNRQGYLFEVYEQLGKNHSVAIAYKLEYFVKVTLSRKEYNDVHLVGVPSIFTRNGYLIMTLHFTQESLSRYPYLRKRGLIIGTTHLYWRPLACYERARQCVSLLAGMQKIYKEKDPDYTYSSFVAGDFNMEPMDAPYSIMANEYDKSDEHVTNGLVKCLQASSEYNNVSPASGARNLIVSHKQIGVEAFSLYKTTYQGQPISEPDFTNWTEEYKGTLDYIFFLSHKKFRLPGDVRSRVSVGEGVKVLRLLQIPRTKEMTVTGLPKIHWSPSDHLSIMAELELMN